MYRIRGADQKVYGPVSGEVVRRWIAEGRANAQSLIQAEGVNQWKALAEFPEFREALGSGAALPSQGASRTSTARRMPSRRSASGTGRNRRIQTFSVLRSPFSVLGSHNENGERRTENGERRTENDRFAR